MRRHEPERTCVGCRGKAPKTELLRLARSPDGGVVVDPEFTSPGRGAYVHRDALCAEEAIRSGGIARALRSGLDRAELARLMEDIGRTIGR